MEEEAAAATRLDRDDPPPRRVAVGRRSGGVHLAWNRPGGPHPARLADAKPTGALPELWGRLVDADAGACRVSRRDVATSLGSVLDLLVRVEGHRLGIVVFGGVEPPVDATFVAWLQRQGLEPRRRLARVGPRPDEHRVRSEDATDFLRRYGHEYAFAWVPAVDPVTGVPLDVAAIAAVAREAGCVVGCDAGAAVGLRQVRLSDWGVDCALASVSGYLGGFEPAGSVIYVRECHRERDTRADGAPAPDGLASVLEDVLRVSPEALEARAGRLASFLRAVVARRVAPSTLIGGDEAEGSLWVSVLVPDGADAAVDDLHRRHNVAAAAVAPSVVALAPAPLYTTYRDCLAGAAALARALDATTTSRVQRTHRQDSR